MYQYNLLISIFLAYAVSTIYNIVYDRTVCTDIIKYDCHVNFTF